MAVTWNVSGVYASLVSTEGSSVSGVAHELAGALSRQGVPADRIVASLYDETNQHGSVIVRV